MALTPNEQIKGVIEKSSTILIALPTCPTTDAIAASLALYLAFEKLKKSVKIVCNEFKLPPSHSFLPKSTEIYSDLTSLRKFIISLDTSRTKVEELSYTLQGEKLNIYITPKNGFFEAADVTTSSGAFAYQLIIVLDAPDFEALGPLFDNNTEFFYHTPTVNIDHQPTNEHFGQINFVELTATSTSEIVFGLIKELGENLLDEYMATALLTGIISKTKSFKTSTVTPKSLAVASHLVASGARRDEIIRHLYQTKSISTLKLWGRVLARLKTGHDSKVIYSLISQDDFAKTGSSEEDLESIIDELVISLPKAQAIVIIYQTRTNAVKVLLSTAPSINALEIFKRYEPLGTKDFVSFTAGSISLVQAEQIVTEELIKYIHPVTPRYSGRKSGEEGRIFGKASWGDAPAERRGE